MIAARPNVLVFDVNETLIDIESLAPIFGRVFGDPRVLREWFGQLVMYSMTITLSGLPDLRALAEQMTRR
jgi:2-haloacid dehalogenase